MSTPFFDVFNTFLMKVSDYNLPKLDDLDKEELLVHLMRSACSKFNDCKIDLTDIDLENGLFNKEIDYQIIDIITEGMLVEWLKPKVFNTEILKNNLSTKDFSMYSPANLLKEMRSTLELAQKNYKSLVTAYSYQVGDFSRLGGKYHGRKNM